MTNLYYLTIFATALICIAIGVVAVMRLRLCCGARRPRIKYTLVMLAAFAGLTQPYFWQYWPCSSALALSIVVLYLLIAGVPPLSFYKDKNDFFDTHVFDPNLHLEDE